MRLPLALLVCLFAAPAVGRELTTAEKRVIPFTADLPVCGDPAVLAKITDAFAEKESQYWNSSLQIVEFAQIKPVAFRPWGLDTIPRRFCSASAMVSDGRARRVDYSVREDLDFIGFSWGVEWCVTGLDRNSAYAPGCSLARP